MTDESARETGDRDYQQQLGATLRRRDSAALRAFLLEQARLHGDQRQVQAISEQPAVEIEQLMHHMILARADLAALHAASRAALGMKPAAQTPRSSKARRGF